MLFISLLALHDRQYRPVEKCNIHKYGNSTNHPTREMEFDSFSSRGDVKHGGVSLVVKTEINATRENDFDRVPPLDRGSCQ